MARRCLRTSAVMLGLVGAVAWAGVAYAHVEVSAQPAVAGSENAIVTFEAAAESSTAGISSVRIVLPQGIAPTDVTLKTGPAGWTLTPTADGYTVGGPTLPRGRDAVHAVTVTRLPDATRLVFKALVNYSDGSVDRWIEEPTTANPNPDNEAPVLELRPGPRPATPTAAPTTAAPTSAAPTTAVAVTTPPEESRGIPWLWWLLGGIALAAAVIGGVVAMRRRTGEGPGPA
jgi:hypothetical protein